MDMSQDLASFAICLRRVRDQPQRKVNTYTLSPGPPVQPAPPGSTAVKQKQ